MKNIIKKVIIIAILAIMALNLCAFRYETEEVPNSLIMALLDEGFKPSEDDEDIWEYKEYQYDGDYDIVYIYAYFDTYENVGQIMATGYDARGRVQAVTLGTVTWNNIDEEMETVAERSIEF